MCQDCTHFDYHIMCCNYQENLSTKVREYFNWDRIKMQPRQKMMKKGIASYTLLKNINRHDSSKKL